MVSLGIPIVSLQFPCGESMCFFKPETRRSDFKTHSKLHVVVVILRIPCKARSTNGRRRPEES